MSLALISCTNYYNQMISWSDNLENGLSIEKVQELQPDYIEIDWDNPRILEVEKWFLITKIKNNYDSLGMSNFLVFIDNKYQYREAKK